MNASFSKKIENHAHSVAMFAMYYNFVRIDAAYYGSDGCWHHVAALGNW